MLLCLKWYLLLFLRGWFTVTALLLPPPYQVSDYSKKSRVTVLHCQLLCCPTIFNPLRPPHSVPCAAESCTAGGRGTETMLLQRYTDASGDGPGVWCLCDGSASTQSTDPGGLCDSAAPTCQHTGSAWPEHTGAAVQEEEQAQNHALFPGVNAVLQYVGRRNKKKLYKERSSVLLTTHWTFTDIQSVCTSLVICFTVVKKNSV